MQFRKMLLMLLATSVFFACEKREKEEVTPKSDMDTEMSENTGPRKLSAKDLYMVKRIGEAQISPDGNWVLYVLSSPSISDNKLFKDIYAVSVDGKETKQITSDDAADFNPRWSPDGKEIAYISDKDGVPQIYKQAFPKGSPVKVTDLENGVSNMHWSPDGKHFSFTSEVKLQETTAEKYPKYPKANVRIYDALPVRHWDHWIDENFSHLFIIPAEGGEVIDVNKGEEFDTPLQPFGGAEEICWSPDGKEIAYTSKKMGGLEFVKSTDSDIYIFDVESGDTRNITQGMKGFDKAPNYSPDGQWIAFHSQERGGFESDRIRIMLYNRENAEIKELTTNLDQWVFEDVWSPDSESMYFTATDSGTVKLFNIDLAGNIKVVNGGWFNHSSPLISSDGQTLVYGKESMLRPVDLYTMEVATKTENQITDLNKELFANIKDAEIREKWIPAKDGKLIHCWVLLPPEFDENKKYPMITYLQGGPQSMIGQRFHFRWNYFLMASNDYVMLLPNRRGLPGFGQEWNDAISLDWGGKPMDDIIAATDHMTKEPYINPDKVGAVGASAGGYAAFWLAGNHEGRFKAFIAHCGVFNLESMYGSTEELWFPNWEYGGPYWDEEHKPNFVKNSPHNYVQNWDTPIMITTGEYDFRVPYTQSLEAFTAAQAQGVESKLLVFPEETHFIAHPQEFIVWSSEFFDWLDKYLK